MGRECDALLVLGDLINVLDYRTMDGILVEVYGRGPVAAAARLRAEGRFNEARAEFRRRAVSDGGESRARFLDLVRQDYRRVFDALPERSYVTFGNVDIPELLVSLKPDHVPMALPRDFSSKQALMIAKLPGVRNAAPIP